MNSLISSSEKNVLSACLVIGLAGAIGGLIYSDRFWFAFLQNSFYFLTVAFGAAVFVAVNYVSNSAMDKRCAPSSGSDDGLSPVRRPAFCSFFLVGRPLRVDAYDLFAWRSRTGF